MLYNLLRTFIIILSISIICDTNINTEYSLNSDNYDNKDKSFYYNNNIYDEKYNCEEGYKYINNYCIKTRNINNESYFKLYLDYIIIMLFIIIIILY
jgi:hypothetical protein